MSERGREVAIGVQLTEALEHWTERLNDPVQFTEDMPGLAEQELNKLWQSLGMTEEKCLISGKAVWAEYVVTPVESDDDEDNGGGIAEVSSVDSAQIKIGDLDEDTAIAKGFEVLQMDCNGNYDEDLPYKIWALFNRDSLSYFSHPAFVQSNQCRLFVEPETMNIFRLNSLQEGDVNMEALNKSSEKIGQLLCGRRFRRMSADAQLTQIDRYVEKAHHASRIIGRHMVFTADKVYLDKRGPTGLKQYYALNTSKSVLGGICLGLSVPGSEYIDESPIWTDDDLWLSKADVCLNVALPESLNIPKSSVLKPGDIVQVPFLSQDVVMEFR